MYKDTISNSFKLGKAARIARNCFYDAGYSEIFLPVIDKHSPGLHGGLKTAFNNEYYVIKPDVTSHLLTSMVKDEELKIFYVSEVLNSLPKGRWQIGAEWIGGKSGRGYKIYEQINLIIEILKKLKISDFQIDIGSLKKWEDVISEFDLDSETIYEAIKKRSFSEIKRLDIPEKAKEKLLENLKSRGKSSGDELIDWITNKINAETLTVDFGTIRHFDYYDDVVLEVYTRNHGRAIGGGGEYQYKSEKCFGFALDLEVLSGMAQFDEKGSEEDD
ncbi:MAG TPA: ATP phosphoribosyltransferase regulatory subunit [Thermotogota bacterium]|nr:ATP phosphoribosyltransferase regulatory subunit [Thermotogota bacterium]HPJ89811.1 ATP phosphoribosyltransferase regulatory subunit [Thermotogota bacterium]HPR96976.1 ATP phosphoribosyltransferase regulatory subunit [Thermotogota bacterium]